MNKKIIWSEIRIEDDSREMFYVLAEQETSEWNFFERSSWELRWYPILSTERLIKRASIESGGCGLPKTQPDRQMRQVA